MKNQTLPYGDQTFIIFLIHKYYICIEFIMLLYTYLVIYFAWWKEYIALGISFSNFSDELPTFTCANGNPWNIFSGVNILRPVALVDGKGNIPILKALRTNVLTS